MTNNLSFLLLLIACMPQPQRSLDALVVCGLHGRQKTARCLNRKGERIRSIAQRVHSSVHRSSGLQNKRGFRFAHPARRVGKGGRGECGGPDPARNTTNTRTHPPAAPHPKRFRAPSSELRLNLTPLALFIRSSPLTSLHRRLKPT
jgi:hypothetical protein